MITLVLGGARSGKSVVAERLAAAWRTAGPADAPPVTYVATLEVGDDADLSSRVELHRRRRPPTWRTVEAGPSASGRGRGGLSDVLREVAGVVVVDSLGPWVGASANMAVDAAELCAALTERDGDSVVVSEEVGLSVHPSSEAGRRFRDVLGALNQAVAACADDVVLVVAGRVLRLDRPDPDRCDER